MKFTFVILSFSFLVLCSCGPDVATPDNRANRKRLTEEIADMKSAIARRDKNKIAVFFDFPVQSNELFMLTEIADSLASGDGKPDKHMLSKELFLKEEDKILSAGLATFFAKIDIAALSSKDTTTAFIRTIGQPCVTTNSIIIHGDTAVFEMLMDKDPEIKGDEDADGVDLSSLCEHQSWWTFALKGGKLKFISLAGAD